MLKCEVIRLRWPPLTSQVDAYLARAAEYDRKAETLGRSNAAIREFYGRLAQHWRSLALMTEHEASRNQSERVNSILLVKTGA
jgi:hypothetical protein